MARNKTHPKWTFPVYIVLTVIMGGFMVYRVVRGGDLFLPSMFILVFGFNAYVSWRLNRKAVAQPPE